MTDVLVKRGNEDTHTHTHTHRKNSTYRGRQRPGRFLQARKLPEPRRQASKRSSLKNPQNELTLLTNLKMTLYY